MSVNAKKPLAIRAAMRGAAVFAAVVGTWALMRAFGVDTSADFARIIAVATIGGIIWAAIYAVSANAVERALARIAAQAEKES